jgi:hypothetical protein
VRLWRESRMSNLRSMIAFRRWVRRRQRFAWMPQSNEPSVTPECHDVEITNHYR